MASALSPRAGARWAREGAFRRAALAPDRCLVRDRGHDVQAVAERTDIVGSTDRKILELAAQEGRAVVTNNVRDFRPLAAQWLAQGRIHAGLILVPPTLTRTRAAVPALAHAIEEVLRDHPDGLAGTERWIGPLSSR